MAGLAIDVIHFISCDVKKIVLFWYKFIKMIRASKGAMSEKTLQGGVIIQKGYNSRMSNIYSEKPLWRQPTCHSESFRLQKVMTLGIFTRSIPI